MRWVDTDRAKAMAYRIEKASKCSMCGTAQWEWDPEQGGSKFAYEAVGVHCQGCYVKGAASDDADRRPGLSFELHPTRTQESAKRLLAAQRRTTKSRVRKSE